MLSAARTLAIGVAPVSGPGLGIVLRARTGLRSTAVLRLVLALVLALVLVLVLVLALARLSAPCARPAGDTLRANDSLGSGDCRSMPARLDCPLP